MARVLIAVFALFTTLPLLASTDTFSVGTSINITEPTEGQVTVLWAPAEISSVVKGDVSMVGGTLTLRQGTEIHGDVVVIFGKLNVEEGALITGNRFVIGAAVLSGSRYIPPGPLMFLLLFWFAVGLIVTWISPDGVLIGCHIIFRNPVRVILTGILALLTGILLLFLGFLLSGIYIGFPLIIFIALVMMGAKIYGITLIMIAIGRKLMGQSRILILLASGALTVFAIRLLPIAGPALWAFLTLPAFGVTILQLSRTRYVKNALFSSPSVMLGSDLEC